MLNKELLEILRCPDCKSELEFKAEENKLICKSCKNEFDVKDGIPIMLPKDKKEN